MPKHISFHMLLKTYVVLLSSCPIVDFIADRSCTTLPQHLGRVVQELGAAREQVFGFLKL
jgi:hypothetical protein